MAKIVILFALAMVTASSSSSSSFFENPTLNANQEESSHDDVQQIVVDEEQEQQQQPVYIFRQARAIACPRQCTCEEHPISEPSGASSQILSPLPLPTVACSKQNLTSVPSGISVETKKLDLSWNNISKIQQQQQPNNLLGHLYNLQELSLRGNELENLESSAFSNLTRLKELTLSKNRLTSVPVSEALPESLEILDLEHNRIARVEGRVLARNGRIRALRLGHNLIESIAPDAFQFLTSLTILELNDNKLTEVPSEALKRLPALKELSLANNRITRIDVPFHLIVPRVVLLQVKDNPIRVVHPDGFSFLHHLKKLILSAVSNLTFPHLNGTTSLEILRIDRCGLESVPDNLCDFVPNLKSLDLKSNKLRRLPYVSQCTELRILDLNSNDIEEIEEDSMGNLSQLHDFHIQKNRILRIEAHTLRGLSNLRVLDLSRNRIEYIDAGAFLHVQKLRDLNLHDNVFPTLPPAGLQALHDLKTHNNPNLKEFPGPEHFPSVRRLYLSYAYHCCQFMGSRGNLPALVPAQQTPQRQPDIKDEILYPTDKEFGNALGMLNLSSMWPGIVNLSNRAELGNDFWNMLDTDIPTGSSFPEDGGTSDDIFAAKPRPPLPNEISCIPQPGPFLPCTDLFDWWTLRCGVWIVFLLALMGNGTVVFVLIFARTKMDVPRFLVCNLAVADFFMGVYLGFLAVVDAATLGEFRRFAIQWQLSSACQIAGFMGVLSSELSVFTLAVITMERHYAITHAMHLNKRLSLRHASYIMVIGWIFALIMATLPLFGASDYRKFAVCLPFETENPASKGYVVFLMFANGVAFTILMGCYLKMYCSIRGSQAWNSNDTRIAKRMALLVFTDLLCWFPIAFFSLTAIFGLQLVSLEEAKVFTVFILPLNSCCNPFLYAILTKQFKKDCVLICKAIEESRVTRGIGRCRHSSNFSNRQTAPNTGSLTEKSSKDGQPCICHSGLHPNGADVNGNAKHRFVKSHERLRSMGPVGRFFSRYILCQDPTKDPRKKEEDYRMRNVRRYLYSNAQTNYAPDAGDGKHQRHASVSSDNFSSSRSDSWRVQNRCGIPLRMIEPRRRNSWAVTRKPSQDSNLSSSRNDSSATSNSTATWRLSRSSVSSDAASHSGGGKSSFKRISSAGNNASGNSSGSPTPANILRPSVLAMKSTMQTSTAAVAAAAAAAAVATGSAAGTDLSAITAVASNPAVLGAAAVVAATNSEEEMALLTRTNTIQNQLPLPFIPGPPPQVPRRASITAVQSAAPGIKKAISAGADIPGGIVKKKKKKRVKIKKPPKQQKEITIIGRSSGSSGAHPDVDNDDEIDDEEASAKIATNRPRLVRQSAFFSEEVVIEPEICPVHGPLNPGTYDDEEEDDDEVSDVDDDDDDDDEDDEEEDEDEAAQVDNRGIAPEPSSHHSIASHHSMVGGVICEEDEEEDIEDPTSPILRQTGGAQVAGITLVIVPRRLSTVRSRDAVSEYEQTAFIRHSGSSSSINNQLGACGGSPLSISPTSHSLGGGPLSSPSTSAGANASNLQHQHSSSNSPTALLLPAGMAHFGRRKMSEQPVKFYVVPATTGLLTSAKWHSMSHVDSGTGGGTSPTAPGSSPNQQRHYPHHNPHHHHHHSPGQVSPNYPSSPTSLRSQHTQQHSRSHSPRQFPKHDTARRLSSSIAETVEETTPLSIPLNNDLQDDHSPTSSTSTHYKTPSVLQREALNEQRRVSFQLPGKNLPPSTSAASSPSTCTGTTTVQIPVTRSNSPPERISPPNPSSSRRASNS